MIYGREEKEWNELVKVGEKYLVEQAKLGDFGMTTYTEFNTVLVNRTGHRSFDFDSPQERVHMGYLLADIATRNCPSGERILSALCKHQNENKPGGGFYDLAVSLGRLNPRATETQKWEFWITEVRAVLNHYQKEDS